MVTFAIGVGVLFALQALIVEFGYLWAALRQRRGAADRGRRRRRASR